MIRILGLGDNVVDRFLDRGRMYPGGQAMNVAVYASMLGAESGYLGVFGTDEMAMLNKAVLKELHVDTSHAVTEKGENAFACVRIVAGERVFLGSNKGGVARERKWRFSKEDLRYIASFQVVHTDQNSYIEDDLPLLHQTGVLISFDFSWKLDSIYLRKCAPYADIAFLSLAGMPEEDAKEKMLETAAFGPRLVVGTRGEQGSIALIKEEWLSQGIIPTQVTETMGAGDSFAAACLVALLESGKITVESVHTALSAAAEFAAKTCTMEGAFGYGQPFILTQSERKMIENNHR